ncbi:aspartate--tRNA ligase [Patescibacteria group bacterium]|nr:aspartate--tRNA ligase [Patescibacteria group bacterium]MCL5798165.1 aspartate--tRNA ligase [Patescibacteria group bacterium]
MLRVLIKDTVGKIGEEVTLYGWVNAVRDHGKITFIDLRDSSGIVQAVDAKGLAKVSAESVVRIVGLIKARPEKMVNPNIETGKVEIEIKSFDVLSKSQELPFPIDGDGYDINEEVRLKYRYLDLRRKRLNRNIRLRSQFVQNIRNFLFSNNFLEVETPLLSQSTPEGSRDFLVPSRLQPGNFYALPQSPQQYKQLLMVAGMERYFQIARCMRDEDLRADRGFEHTQIDIEMSFVEREDVMNILEKMITEVMEKMGQKIKKKPFPVFTYKEAMEKFKSDKFDLRTEEEKKESVKAFAWVIDFPFFEKDKEGKWTFTHNPFSNPMPEYVSDLLQKKNIEGILTSQYDLVCNGFEVGGGSIRSHDPQILESVFEVMGYKKDEIKQKFGHMLTAFSYGTPPHGGCAFGVDRLMMILTGEQYLREVVAFPMTSGGRTAVMDAPSPVSPTQLRELGLSLRKSEK